MTELDPRVDFAALSDRDIAELGLEAAVAAFERDVKAGLTNNDSLALVIGLLNHSSDWTELARRLIGPDAEEFLLNINPHNGKLATALRHRMNSVDAYEQFGTEVPNGPQRYTGAVFHTARVKTEEAGWLSRNFVGAASGVQGHFDMATVYSALTRMGALWALKMQAVFGKAS